MKTWSAITSYKNGQFDEKWQKYENRNANKLQK